MLEIPGSGQGATEVTLLKNCRAIVHRIMAGGEVPTGFYSNPDEWYRGCADAMAQWFAKQDQ
ncbi:hypothetical protein [Streptomyces sp. NPDC052494]|uniref:hypothetical protein n=1 Tax=Streptomyces sp. NPDC052494 TaxID=3365692 RepID=UPI0037D86F97